MKNQHTPGRVCKCGDTDCFKAGRAGHYVPSQNTPDGPYTIYEVGNGDIEIALMRDTAQVVARVGSWEQAEGLVSALDAKRDLLAALQNLVNRCDGAEGVRADGSNIQTIRAHAVLAKAEAQS